MHFSITYCAGTRDCDYLLVPQETQVAQVLFGAEGGHRQMLEMAHPTCSSQLTSLSDRCEQPVRPTGSGDLSFLGFASWIKQALHRSSDTAFLLPSCRNAIFVRHALSRSSKGCVSLLYMYMTLDSSLGFLSPISTVPLMVLSHCSRLNAVSTLRQRQRLHSQLLRASAILTKEEPRQAPTLVLISISKGWRVLCLAMWSIC